MITTKITQDFLNSLDQGRYFQAHEVLEELWYPKRFENTNEIRILKGFINAAVSFELIKRGRPNPAKQVWRNYLKYRQLIFKLNSKKQNIYYKISLEIEKRHKSFI